MERIIISYEFVERLQRVGKVEFDRLVGVFLDQKKLEYKVTHNSSSIIDSLTFFISSIKCVKHALTSYRFGLLHKFKAQLLLDHACDREDLTASMAEISMAIDIILNTSVINIDQLVNCYLIRAVLYKVLGDKDEALYSIENSRKELNIFNPCTAQIIKLNRQEQLIYQSHDSHKRMMAEAAMIVKTNSIEYYSSIKRIIEFYMNNSLNDDKRKIVELFKKSFSLVQHELPLVSKVSFLKNMGQYHLTEGNIKMGCGHLALALQKARDFNLTGQRLQLENLLKASSSSSNLELITFRI